MKVLVLLSLLTTTVALQHVIARESSDDRSGGEAEAVIERWFGEGDR